MRLDELNWMDVEEYLKRDDRLMLVLGSCEQHGYLSLLTDVKIPLALADAASEKTDILVAPPLNFGISPYFLAYPGTISLRVSTMLEVVEDMVRSVYSQGFRRILVLNGHGGNDPVRSRLMELSNSLQGLKVNYYSWWQSHSVLALAERHQLKTYHAGWMEAFPFVQVCDLPHLDKLPPAHSGILNAEEARRIFGDGVFGGPYQVDEHIMSELFAEILKDVLFLLEF
jgi:creatinine amidohydrolase